jgi:hypothetical protein
VARLMRENRIQAIQTWCNRKRRCSTLGFLSLVEFERKAAME